MACNDVFGLRFAMTPEQKVAGDMLRLNNACNTRREKIHDMTLMMNTEGENQNNQLNNSSEDDGVLIFTQICVGRLPPGVNVIHHTKGDVDVVVVPKDPA